jgi:diguanylate cyclase (GGDEF)-like protein/putative nucleotidyltransferase with HDIG domain
MSAWSSLPRKVKIYLTVVFSAALPIFLWALRDVLTEDYGGKWILLTAITLITVPIFVFLPSVRSLVTIGDAFVISICMLYGTAPAVLANTLYFTLLTLLLRGRHQTTIHRIFFNIATAVLTVGIYGFLYSTLNPSRSLSLEDIVIPTFAIALTYFLTNSLLVATAIALTSQTSVFSIWVKNYIGLCLDFLVSACAGAFVVYFSNFHVIAPLLVAPFVAAIWGINKVNRAKAIEAERHLEDQEQLYLRTVESLALAVDAKDPTTYGHIRRVRAYAMGLARLRKINNPSELMAIETGSLLHDIGKIAIDDYILNKPGRLTRQEFEKMKVHAAAGDEILQQVQFPFPVAEYVRSHHERWDGLGYPDGLKGESIPLGARILAIADAFDAIRSSRPYKLSFGLQDSVELLRAQARTLYDPQLIELFVNHISELEAAAQEAAKNVPELSFRKYFEKIDLNPQVPSSTVHFAPTTTTASEELLQLIEFCNSYARNLDLSDILPILSRRLETLVRTTNCIFFLDNGDGTLKAAHASGNCAELFERAEIGLGKGISGWVAAYKKPILNTRPALDLKELGCKDCNSLTDALVVPLTVDDTCIGTISLYAEPPISFTQADLDLLQGVAEQIAPVIVDARGRHARSDTRKLIDPVTNTYRVAYLSFAGSQFVAAAAKDSSPLSLLLIDVKNLSQIVNLYGISTSDDILRKVADTLRGELREIDILVRYGYRGFVALLPGVRMEQAARYAQRLTQLVRTNSTPGLTWHSAAISCQAAVACYPNDGATIYDLLQSAQRTLLEQTKLATSTADDREGNILEFPPRI